jgi:dTDP-4-amino-4,6-dideoxygalactose transaminase
VGARYGELLAGSGVEPPRVPPEREHTYQSYQALLPDGVDPEKVIARLAERRIAARRGIMLCHRERPYADQRGPFPGAERAWSRAILLPLHGTLSDEDLARVATAVRGAL